MLRPVIFSRIEASGGDLTGLGRVVVGEEGEPAGIEALEHYTQTKSIQVELSKFESVF